MIPTDHRRILHIITGLGTGGAEMMLYKLLSRLDRDRFDPSVLSLTTSGSVGEMISELGIPVHTLGFRPGSMNPRDLLALVRMARKLSPHLIHTWLYKADLLGGIAGKFSTRVPVVWGIRASILDPHRTARSTLLARKFCALTSPWLPDRIVSCSHAGAEVHAELGYARRKIEVIPNGFDLGEFKPDDGMCGSVREELGISPEQVLILNVGRFDPLKDYPTLFQAAAMLKVRRQAFVLALCGLGIDGDNPELTQLLREQGVLDDVRLLGPRNDVRRLMQAADVYVSSSKGEGFPNVVGEAMACGLPCAVTDAGDSARIVGETGRVAPVRDPGALADALAALTSLNGGERQALGRAARDRIETHYELSAVVRQFENLYENLLCGIRAVS